MQTKGAIPHEQDLFFIPPKAFPQKKWVECTHFLGGVGLRGSLLPGLQLFPLSSRLLVSCCAEVINSGW